MAKHKASPVIVGVAAVLGVAGIALASPDNVDDSTTNPPDTSISDSVDIYDSDYFDPGIVTEPLEVITEPPEIVTEPPEIVTEPPEIVTEPPAIVTEPPKPTITIKHSDSSMTPDLVEKLENIAVFWAPTGTKKHIKSSCRSFNLGFVYAGTLSEANKARDGGWCGTCSSGMTDEKFKNNQYATAAFISGCYTYNDYLRKIPAKAYDG